MIMPAGKLIVIDGTDGSGKATQVALLAERLKQKGHSVTVVDFPRYGQPSAYFVEQYLNGRYGSLAQIGSYEASLFFALDRYDAAPDMKRALADGAIVLSNRYVSSNMGHQAAKITDANERRKLYTWLHELEYKILGIPQPDLSVILHLAASTGQKLVEKKGFRQYLDGHKKDLHESDLSHLQAAERVYLEIAAMYNYEVVECEREGVLMTPDEISALIWQIVTKIV